MLEIETRMSMLEEDEKVREYIELQNEKIKIDNDKFVSRVRDLSDFEIAIKAFDYTCTKTKDSNNVYVFMGYSTDVCSDKEKRIYRNLETLEELKIDFKNELQFIKENKIILSSAKDKEYFFSMLKANFFKYLTTNSQEQSVEKNIKIS